MKNQDEKMSIQDYDMAFQSVIRLRNRFHLELHLKRFFTTKTTS